MIYYILSYTQNTLRYTNLKHSKTLKDPRWLWPDRMVKPSPQIKWLILASPGCFWACSTIFCLFKGCRPCRSINQTKLTYIFFGASRFRLFPFFICIFWWTIFDMFEWHSLIKYFDIVRKPTHQTLSPPWAVPRRLQPECGSWAREFLNR